MRALSAEQRVAHLQRIQSAYSRCKEYSDDKVQLAMQTYEMVRRRAGCGAWAGSARRASAQRGGRILHGAEPRSSSWLPVRLAGKAICLPPFHMYFDPLFGQL